MTYALAPTKMHCPAHLSSQQYAKLLDLNRIAREAFQKAEVAAAAEASARRQLRDAEQAFEQADWALTKASDELAEYRKTLGLRTSITL